MKTVLAVGAVLTAMAGGAASSAEPASPGLLDDGRQAQLERWLGAGELVFDTLYVRRPGDTSARFHAAVDGRGATFTLIDVDNGAGQGFLVGGYNPQSWSSTDGWHETASDAERTAFLFNFSTPAVYRQVPTSYALPSQGLRQTYNDIQFGPVFGAGPDLLVDAALDQALSWQLSYGDPRDEGRSIIDASLGGQIVSVAAIEVYAVAPVPEPAPAFALLAGLAVVGAALRRRRQACAVFGR